MRFSHAIDAFVSDMQAEGKLRTRASERSYRDPLLKHAEDCDWRDPRTTNREDVKRTLARWPNENTRANRHSAITSFYDWLMQEGMNGQRRKNNPAREVRRVRKRKPARYRLTLAETRKLLFAPETRRERWFVFLAVCVGLRLNELRGLQGRHFARHGAIWVSEDIAKGNKERWEPVLADLAPIVADIMEHCDLDDYVFSAQRWRNPGTNTERIELRKKPGDSKVLWRMAHRIGVRAGIPAPVTPHMLRHAFAEHIARGTGDMKIAQALLGHADLSSTQTYLGEPTLDELTAAVRPFSFGSDQLHLTTRMGHPSETEPAKALIGATGIEPVLASIRALMLDREPLSHTQPRSMTLDVDLKQLSDLTPDDYKRNFDSFAKLAALVDGFVGTDLDEEELGKVVKIAADVASEHTVDAVLVLGMALMKFVDTVQQQIGPGPLAAEATQTSVDPAVLLDKDGNPVVD